MYGPACRPDVERQHTAISSDSASPLLRTNRSLRAVVYRSGGTRPTEATDAESAQALAEAAGAGAAGDTQGSLPIRRGTQTSQARRWLSAGWVWSAPPV